MSPWWILLSLASAQGPDPYEQVRRLMEAAAERQRQAAELAMEASLARQRASVQAQVRAAANGAASFFTTAWTAPLIAAPPAIAEACEPIPEDQIGPLVNKIAEREGLTPDLLRAVIEKESSWLPCAISPKGALGLMQLMPATALELGVEDPLDPAQNISGGARLLRRLLSRYGGDLALALGAYNAGPAYVDAFRGLPPFRETLNYVSSILGRVQTGPRDAASGGPE